MSWSLLLDISVKGAVLLAAAWALTSSLRRASAATRHLLWTAAMAGLVLMPALLAVLLLVNAPRPEMPVMLPAVVDVVLVAPAADSHAVDWRRWAVWLWAIGAALLGLRLAVAVLVLSRMVSRAAPVDDVGWRELAREVAARLGLRRAVRLRASPAVSMPVSCGTLRHTVLLPEQAGDWPEDRRRIVLLHEIAHAARRDPLTQVLAQAACCLYWFNPLVWLAARRMAIERERACDDRVLASGAAASVYAGHLVEIARVLRGRKPWMAAAIAMANRSQLEPRLIAILDRHLRRAGLTPKRVVVVAAAAALLVLPLAALRARSGNLGALSGVIYDGVGVVPNAEVTLRGASSGRARQVVSDGDGGYRFDGLEAGAYELLIRAPGFAEHRVATVPVRPGAEARRISYLRLGSVQEQLDVVAQRPAAVSARASPAPRRIRVGGHVQPPKLLKMVRPSYPEEARQAGAEGYVAVRAIVRTDGTLGTLTVIDAPHPALAEAARQALSRWVYQPVRLNGDPVEVETLVNVRFRLTQ